MRWGEFVGKGANYRSAKATAAKLAVQALERSMETSEWLLAWERLGRYGLLNDINDDNINDDNINDVLNKNKNKPNNLVQATVPQKDILIVLPYLVLHSNQVTKRLKSCVYNFYSFVNLKIIFQNTPRIKSFFSIQRSLEPISEVQGLL